MKWALAALALAPAAATAQTYDVTRVTGAAVNPVSIAQTGTPLRLGDDNTAVVSLGFAFPYYGQTFTQAYISSNGFLNFSSNFNGCCSGQPMADAPRNGIYVYWTDLISATSPYVQTATMPDGSKVFTAQWQTYEYGTRNLENFAVQLDQSGRIALTYGDLSATSHTASAGLTGPTATDNAPLFYGFGGYFPNHTAYALVPGMPKQSVNCSITPNDLSCISSTPVAPAAQTAVATTTSAAAPAPQDTAVVTASAATSDTAQTVAAQAAQAAPAVKAPERLTPDQLKALLAGGPPVAIPGALAAFNPIVNQSLAKSSAAGPADTSASSAPSVATSTATQAATFNDLAIVAQATASASMSVGPSPSQAAAQAGLAQVFSVTQDLVLRDPVSLATTPVSVAADVTQQVRPNAVSSQQTAITALSLMPAAKPVQRDPDTAPAPQDASLAALAVQPQGFTAYQAKRMADAVFYAPRDIYKRQKPIDAYMTLYRLLQSGDRRWEAMTEAQYGKQ